MTTRYWAPQRPTVEPDAVVLAMLEPGDIGSSVLAVHRAGAAAMETVSKGSVPSEEGLIEAIVAARMAVADKVVDSVAKSAGPSYAGLFVMDVFDDAEHGAMHIYRTAVSKGVAPPLAAQRAADVFGVPASSMGKYAQLATDPRGNPVAVRDLADRTLLEYTSRLVQVETETVGKADGQQYEEAPREHKPWREADVVRDAIGRFAEEPGRPTRQQKDDAMAMLRAQLGLTGSAPPEVAGVPTTEPKAEEQAATPKRRQRRRRVLRATPKRAEARRAAPKRSKAQRAEIKRAEIARAAERRAVAPINRTAVRRGQKDSKKPGKDLVPVKVHGDLLAVRPGYEHFDESPSYELDQEIVLRTDVAFGDLLREALNTQARGFKDPTAWALRIGYLTDIAARNSTAEVPGTKADTTNLDTLSTEILEASDTVPPMVEIIHARDISNSGETESDYVENRRRAQATVSYTTREGQKLWLPDADEDNYTLKMPTYQPYGGRPDESDELSEPKPDLGEYAIVHYLPPDPTRPNRRPMPTIDEFVLLGNPRGYEDRTTKRVSYELDPNQAYKFVPAPGESTVEGENLWDGENGIMVVRWYLQQIDEDDLDDLRGNVHKADDQQYQEAPKPRPNWRESDVLRDALGRFADEPGHAQPQAEEPAAEEPAAPKYRVRRARRVRRAPIRAHESIARAEPTRAGPQRAEVQRTPFQQALHRAMNRAVVQRAELKPDMPVLFDNHDYKVFTEHQWGKAINLLDDEDLMRLHSGEEVALDPITRRAFAESTVRDVHELPTQLSVNVDGDPSLRQQFQHLQYLPIAQARDFDVLAGKIEALFNNHPEVDKIEMIRHGDVLALSGNVVPAGHQTIVEVPRDINWSKPVSLIYVDEYRAREMGTRSQRGDIEALISPTGSATDETGEGAVTNPIVHLYRVSVRHYRGQNTGTQNDSKFDRDTDEPEFFRFGYPSDYRRPSST